MVNNIMLRAYMWATSARTNAIESLKQESGQDLIEYAVMVGAIAIIAFAALTLAPLGGAGGAVDNFGQRIAACISFNTVGNTAC